MKTLIFDGNNLAWRSMMRLPELTANRRPVQVVYGFLRVLRSSLTQFQPDVALVCWDNGRSEYRRKLYPEYKATRDHESSKEKQQEYQSINYQMATLRSVLELLNISSVSYPKTEADDLIGIAAQQLKGYKTIITSDQDALHLVNDCVEVWSPIKTTLYNGGNFRSKIGLSPQQFLELRAMTGDKSDNISGCAKGFGVQTAQNLLEKYGSIEKLLNSKGIAKRVESMGNRYALLYSDGARERIYRNLLLMDLRMSIQRTEGKKAGFHISEELQKRHKIDQLKVREYFKGQRFSSLLEGFQSWLSPFENLDTSYGG